MRLILVILVVGLVSRAVSAPPQQIVVPGASTQPAGAAARGDSLADHLDSQLLLLISGQPFPATQDLLHLAADDRELISILIDGLARFRAAARAKANQTNAEKIRPLLVMSQRLQNRANLQVLNVTLCRSVSSFGVYEPDAEAQRPRAGRELPTVLYCEIENFIPRIGAGEMFETKLTYELALFSEKAPTERLMHKPPTLVLDQCRNRRRDFFIADQIALPATLKPGPHLLKVTVTDEQAKRVGEAVLRLEVAR